MYLKKISFFQELDKLFLNSFFTTDSSVGNDFNKSPLSLLIIYKLLF